MAVYFVLSEVELVLHIQSIEFRFKQVNRTLDSNRLIEHGIWISSLIDGIWFRKGLLNVGFVDRWW